jgi:hypothetical protein
MVPEVFTADPDDRRELMVQIWYPAEGDPSSPRAPYIQDADAVTSAFARLFDVPQFLLGNLKYITTNAIPSGSSRLLALPCPLALLFLASAPTTSARQQHRRSHRRH